MRTKLLVSLLVFFLLLTAYGQNDAVTESAWTQALRDIEALTGIHFVLDTDLPAEFTTQEADSTLAELRAYREEDEVGQATASLFIWEHNPNVVDWFVTVPDFDEDVWKRYHADGTVEREPLSDEFKEAYRELLKLTGRQ